MIKNNNKDSNKKTTLSFGFNNDNTKKNSSNNIHKAHQSKPKHDFNTLVKKRKAKEKQKNLPTTTMKVDLPTLHKIQALQTMLKLNTRTQTLNQLINKVAVPDLIKNGKINKSMFKQAYKIFSMKQ